MEAFPSQFSEDETKLEVKADLVLGLRLANGHVVGKLHIGLWFFLVEVHHFEDTSLHSLVVCQKPLTTQQNDVEIYREKDHYPPTSGEESLQKKEVVRNPDNASLTRGAVDSGDLSARYKPAVFLGEPIEGFCDSYSLLKSHLGKLVIDKPLVKKVFWPY